jgi:HSP20 family molecular chaperone IbpA
MRYFNSNLDDFFDGFFSSKFNSPFVVKANIGRSTSDEQEDKYEVNFTKDGAYLLFEVPGFNKTNLKVYSEDGVLFINGTRSYKLNGEEVSKSVSKQFNIGNDYKAETIEATIDDGILTVFIPNYKKQEKKRINII